ncbi:hypothetical protein BconGalA64_35820 [Burkholderia contaminans]|nr:hypothetical protein BconGalA64_35820 [Burkholderia contaminans]
MFARGGVVESTDADLPKSCCDRAGEMPDFVVDEIAVRHMRRRMLRPQTSYHGCGQLSRDGTVAEHARIEMKDIH